MMKKSASKQSIIAIDASRSNTYGSKRFIKTILDGFNFPSGTIHMAQTLTNFVPQYILDSTYIANAEVIQENQRSNATVLKVQFNIEKKGFGDIVAGSTTLMIPG